jgi:hypothetical protein
MKTLGASGLRLVEGAYTAAQGVTSMAYYQYTVKYLCGDGDDVILVSGDAQAQQTAPDESNVF